MDNQRIVALLPMKANSTRIVNKNFRDFCGKPLFLWTLDTLLAVDLIDMVVINTDARDILEKYNVKTTSRIKIRDRKKNICGDNVSMNLVLADDVANVDADTYIMTHTTNPLISIKTILNALKVFKDSEMMDSLFSVNKIQTRFYNSNGKPVNHNPESLIPTQDMEPWYEENSNLYIFSRSSFINSNSRIGKRKGFRNR